MKQKIRKDDNVCVISGPYKGKTGKVVRVVLKNTSRSKTKKALELYCVVEGVNVRKKHMKPNPRANQPGGIVQKEAPIHASNLMLVNPASGKPERVGFRVLEDGRKVRYFKKSNEVVDV